MCRLVHKQQKLPTPQRLLFSASWQVGIYPLHTILVHLVTRLRDSQGDAELHYISCQFRQRTRDLLEPLWRFINTSVLFLRYRWPVCSPLRARGSAPASLSSPSAIPVVAGGAVMACLILRFTRTLGTPAQLGRNMRGQHCEVGLQSRCPKTLAAPQGHRG